MKKIAGGILLGVGLFLLLALALSIFQGKSSAFKDLFQIILNPGISIKYPAVILGTLVQVGIQVAIIWAFIYGGKRMLRSPPKEAISTKNEQQHQDLRM
jgi:hypothetical protein